MLNRVIAVVLSATLLIPQTFSSVRGEPGEYSVVEEVSTDEILEDEVLLEDGVLSEDEVLTEDSEEESYETGEEIEESPFFESTIINGVEIRVSAPANVFPIGARLDVTAVSSRREINKIEETLQDALPDEYSIEETYSFDIKILDEEGDEIEPDTSYGQVEVAFSNVGAKEVADDDEKELSIFHVTDDLETATEVNSTINYYEDTAVIEAEHFSIYTVVIVTGNKNGKIFHYYQGPTRAKSYFTIYDENELLSYVDLINSYQNGTLQSTDSIQTILVNSDESNPIEGITGNGQSSTLKVSDLYFSAKIMDDIKVTKSWNPINVVPSGVTIDGNGKTLKFTDLDTTELSSGDYGIFIKENQGLVRNIILSGDYSFNVSGNVNIGGLVGYNNGGTIINSIFNNGTINCNERGSANIGLIAGRMSSNSTVSNVYIQGDDLAEAIGDSSLGTTYNILKGNTEYPSLEQISRLNQWVENSGTVDSGTLYWSEDGLVKEMPQGSTLEEEEPKGVVRVTVRVNGRKAEIGQAITGAEALALREEDNENAPYITLVRSDDLSVYETDLSNLEEDKKYDIYYVYEDENETISSSDGSLIISREHTEATIEYVSVSYDIEGANTYKKVPDKKGGYKLSENIMAAVRVNATGDGEYHALEDYTAVIKAVEGFEIPTLEKNVKVSVNGVVLSSGITYYYDSSTKEGTIIVDKSQITNSMKVSVKADALSDHPSCTIILHTKGGSVADPLWEKDSSDPYKYKKVIYEGESVSLPRPNTYLNSNSVEFKGWYKTITPSGSPVTNVEFNAGATYHYYAEYVLAKGQNESSNIAQGNNGKMWYSYNTHGNADVRGYLSNGSTFKTTYGNAGFSLAYSIGDITDSTGQGYSFNTNRNVGESAFVNPYGNIWVSEQFTFDGNYIYMTYIIENRDQSNDFNNKFNLALGADIQIGDGISSDRATIKKYANYISMTADGNAFVLYIDGKDFGVDKVDRYWYGYYSGNGYFWSSKMFEATPDSGYDGKSDSAMSYGWTINSIPAGGIVTRSLKIGAGDATSLSNLSGTFMSGVGKFSDGSTNYSLESNSKNIEVKDNGEVWVDNVKKIDPNLTASAEASARVKTLTREGYKFAYWSTTDADYSANPPKFSNKLSDNLTLYAIWVPKPDRYVKNASSIQKVKGNDNLIVPKELGSITIKNTTPGSQDERGNETFIYQGETVLEAAGYASGFSGVMQIDGADDRYLLPDDITVTIIGTNGIRTVLTKGTGYEYRVWNNRKNANIIVKNQFINGDVEIKAVGYELPPVTATSLSTSVKAFTLMAGETAEFAVHAVTSKNHVASYQWYIAPYYEITLDNKLYWTYQNQDGTAIQNGQTNLWGIPVFVSGANKDTLRIDGLTVNSAGVATNDIGLHKGGYHVYCVVTSTRNITGQQVIAVSNVAEVEVTQGQYPAPTGLIGSAATYKGNPGSADGKVIIKPEPNRPKTLQYKKKELSTWINIPENSAEVTGLVAGTYQFRYKEDANNKASSSTEIVVSEGRQIKVTFDANGGTMNITNENELTLSYEKIEKLVDYGTSVSAASLGILNPNKTGNVFSGWENDNITSIKEDTIISASYSSNIIPITLDNQGADEATKGSEIIYENYGHGFYKAFVEDVCRDEVSGDSPIDLPKKAGYDFLGYYSGVSDGVRMINPDGCLNSNIGNTSFLREQTLYARWEKKALSFNSPNGQVNTTPESVSNLVNVTVTNTTGRPANIIYTYIDGILNEELTKYPVEFINNKYSFNFDTNAVGGTVTFIVGYSENISEGQSPDAPQNATYNIYYKNVDGSRDGADFEGAFITTKPEKAVYGVPVSLPNVSRTGYTFVGWFTTARGTGNSIITIPETNSSDITVYAKWMANKYTLVLETNGGEYIDGYTPALQYEHGKTPEVVLPLFNNIRKEGYNFAGWYKNSDLGSDGADPVETVDRTQIGKVTYYLKWEEIPHYTITFAGSEDSDRIYLIKDLREGIDSPIQVTKGDSYSFRVLLKSSSYRIETVYINGRPIFAANGIYTIEEVDDNITITVETKKLAETDKGSEHPNAVAYVDLPDGTTAFFEAEGAPTDATRAAALQKAIDFASKEYQGDTNLTVKLNQDIKDQGIQVEGTNSITLDLNGHRLSKTDGGTSALLIKSGGSLQITNSSTENKGEGYLTIPVHNNGSLVIADTVVVLELQNNFETTNFGSIVKLLQQEAEGLGRVSKIDNREGVISEGDLKSGYLISDTKPDENITGYTVVMNGNQYYVDFQTAVNIASEMEGDSNIIIDRDVDLKVGGSDQSITVGKPGKKISIDLNGHNIHNGTINVVGDVEFVNTQALGAEKTIDSTINNDGGKITVSSNVKMSGEITNGGTNSGEIVVNPGGAISNNITNNENGSITNNSTITASVINKGDLNNNGNMNNVMQQGGHIKNNGVIENNITLLGGSYEPGSGNDVNPKKPNSGVTVTVDTSPVSTTKYYATLKDAIEDINNTPLSDNTPLVIKLSNDIILEENIALTPQNPAIDVTFDLNGHSIRSGSDGAGNPTGGMTISGGSVKFEDTKSEEISSKGKMNAPVSITGGTIINNISIDTLNNNGGIVENYGAVTTLTQDGGQTNNNNGGSITNLNQNGGTTNNNGAISNAQLSGGGFTGEGIIKDGQSPVAEFAGKSFLTLEAALIYAANNGGGEVTLLKDTNETVTFAPGSGSSPVTLKLGNNGASPQVTDGGSISLGSGAKIGFSGTETFVPIGAKAQIGDIIYGDIESAIDDANKSDTETTIKLLDNVDVVASSGTTFAGGLNIENKNGKKITLDLNGKTLGDGEDDGVITVKTGFAVVDSSSQESVSVIKAPVSVEESATLTVGNKTELSGTITNSGSIKNEGTISGNVNHNGGQFEGNPVTGEVTGGSIALKTKDDRGNTVTRFYQDLQSAVNDAKPGDEIKLLKDVDGTDSDKQMVNIETSGIVIDLDGHNIGANTEIVVADSAKNPGVIVKDSKGGSSSGSVSGRITGNITNNGGLTILGNTEVNHIINNGVLNNNGSIASVSQTNGTLNNTGEGAINELNQTGGITNNSGEIETVDIAGGGFKGNVPRDDEGGVAEGFKVKIGNDYYADLESAIAEVNKSPGNVLIEILEDVELPDSPVDLGNENGKTITIDLAGHEITGGDSSGLNLVSPGKVVVKDSVADESNGSSGGSLDVNIVVSKGATLTVETNTDIGGIGNKGNIINNGSVENLGTILGEVDNKSGGLFTNSPSGVITGEIVNTGSFTNRGNIENDIINDKTGKFLNDSSGRINSQLENRGDAVTENSGSILQVNVAGGLLSNKEGASINTLLQVGGEIENTGEIKDIEGASAILTYTDKNGKTRNEYISSIEEAIMLAESMDSDVIITLTEDAPQKDNIIINKPIGSIKLDLNGHSIGSGSKTIELAQGDLTIDDSSESGTGGVLSPIKQTGGTMRLSGGDYYGVTLAPKDSGTKMNTDLSGGSFTTPPGTYKSAITVTGPNPQNTLLKALGQDETASSTLRTENGSGAGIKVDSDSNIYLEAGLGEKLKLVTPGENDSIKSDLELLQKLNEGNRANAIITENGVKLNQDITVSNTLDISGDVNLDLNEKTLTGPNGDRKLSQNDMRDQTGKPAINLEEGSNINITGRGTIQGGRGASTMQKGVAAGVGGDAITYKGNAPSKNDLKEILNLPEGVTLEGTLEKGDDGFALGDNPPEIILNDELRHPELLNDWSEKLYDLEVKVVSNTAEESFGTEIPVNSIVNKDVKVQLDVPEILADIGVTPNTTKIDVSINIVQKDHTVEDNPDTVEINRISDFIVNDLHFSYPELKEEVVELGMVIDITLRKTLYENNREVPIEGNDNALIPELKEDITFTIELPKDMQGGSNYKVIRHHDDGSDDGEVSIVSCEVDDPGYPTAITFSSKKFSYFGIVYTPREDKGNPADPGDGPDDEDDGDGGNDSDDGDDDGDDSGDDNNGGDDGDNGGNNNNQNNVNNYYSYNFTTQSNEIKREKIPVYRLYNSSVGDHLLTTNKKEKDYCVGLGWRDEGIAFMVYNEGDEVYRLYNKNVGEHFYTTNKKERDVLISRGWKYEGVAFHSNGTEDVYRLYSGRMHLFTKNPKEKDYLVKMGWKLESIAFKTVLAK